MELAWVLDVSGTITSEDHEKTKKFVNTLQAKIGLKNNNNKAAVVTYGDYAHKQIKCDDFEKVYDFSKKVDTLPNLPKQFTNTRDGLEKGQELLWSHGCGDPEIKKFIILLTDGLANRGIGNEAGLVQAAKDIQRNGTIIFVVAIGQFSDSQLAQMVDKNKYIHRTKAISKDAFASLNNEEFVSNVKDALCGNIRPERGESY